MNSHPSFLQWLVPVVLIPLCAAQRTYAGGDSVRSVILSPRVGGTIDRVERDRFRLFPRVNRFDSARVIMTDYVHYHVIFALTPGHGAPRESSAVITPLEVVRLSETIDHFEEIESGNYILGSTPATIRDDGQTVTVSTGSVASSTNLPLGEPPGPRPAEMRWVFYLGGGASFHPGDFGGVADMFSEIEARYAQHGYPVTGTPTSFSAGARTTFVVKVYPIPALSVTAELMPRGSEKDFAVGYASGFLDYSVPIDRLARLRWQSSVGYGWYSLKAERGYGNTRISPVDTVTGYYYLSTISIDARCHSYALQTGIVFAPVDQIEFLLYGRYTWIPEHSVTLVDGSTAALRLTLLHWGIRLHIGFY